MTRVRVLAVLALALFLCAAGRGEAAEFLKETPDGLYLQLRSLFKNYGPLPGGGPIEFVPPCYAEAGKDMRSYWITVGNALEIKGLVDRETERMQNVRIEVSVSRNLQEKEQTDRAFLHSVLTYEAIYHLLCRDESEEQKHSAVSAYNTLHRGMSSENPMAVTVVDMDEYRVEYFYELQGGTLRLATTISPR